MVSCEGYGGLRAPATESIVNGTHSIAQPHSLRSETGLRSARCVAKILADQVSSSFLGAGGILNSINCDATGSLPIEARSDLVLLCVNSGTCPGTMACNFQTLAIDPLRLVG